MLDLGCGNGIPAASWPAEDGFRVTGVDLSDTMVERARTLVPEGRLARGDMTVTEEVDVGASTFDAVVSLYALIHVTLDDQPCVIARVGRWLRPRGLFVATVGHTAWTGTDSDWLGGAPHVVQPPRGDLSALDRVGRTRHRRRAFRGRMHRRARAVRRHWHPRTDPAVTEAAASEGSTPQASGSSSTNGIWRVVLVWYSA